MAQVTIRSQWSILVVACLLAPVAGMAEPPPPEWQFPTDSPPTTPGGEAPAGPAILPEAPAPSTAPKPSVSLPDWLSLGAEYRVQTLHIQPLDLNGTDARRASYTEQRLRLDLGLNVPNFGVSLITQFDFLDGVLFGDNGDWGGASRPRPPAWESPRAGPTRRAGPSACCPDATRSPPIPTARPCRASSPSASTGPTARWSCPSA